MLTNLDSTYIKFHKNFDIFGHAICYNCIGKIIFTSHLNELPSYEDIKRNCKCNRGSIQMSTDDLDIITSKLNLPTADRFCENHNLLQIKFCLECKKIFVKNVSRVILIYLGKIYIILKMNLHLILTYAKITLLVSWTLYVKIVIKQYVIYA